MLNINDLRRFSFAVCTGFHKFAVEFNSVILNRTTMKKMNQKSNAGDFGGFAGDGATWWNDGTQCVMNWHPSFVQRAKILCGCGVWCATDAVDAMPVYLSAHDESRTPSTDERRGLWFKRAGGLRSAVWHPSFVERMKICAGGVWVCVPSANHPHVVLDVEEVERRFGILERLMSWWDGINAGMMSNVQPA